MANEMHDWAMLSMTYKGVSSNLGGYYMPAAILERRDVRVAELEEIDKVAATRLQQSVHRELERIYSQIILPIQAAERLYRDSELLASYPDGLSYLKDKAKKTSILDINRMFG